MLGKGKQRCDTLPSRDREEVENKLLLNEKVKADIDGENISSE